MGMEFVVLFSFYSWYLALKSSNDTFFVQSIIIWVKYGNVFIQRTLKSWLLETKRKRARGRRNKKFHIINTDRQYEKARICFQTRRASTTDFNHNTFAVCSTKRVCPHPQIFRPSTCSELHIWGHAWGKERDDPMVKVDDPKVRKRYQIVTRYLL